MNRFGHANRRFQFEKRRQLFIRTHFLAADTFVAVVRRAAFAGLFAVRLVRRKGGDAKDCYQNGKQSLRICLVCVLLPARR